VKVSEK